MMLSADLHGVVNDVLARYEGESDSASLWSSALAMDWMRIGVDEGRDDCRRRGSHLRAHARACADARTVWASLNRAANSRSPLGGHGVPAGPRRSCIARGAGLP